MPELPEVESVARSLRPHVVGRVIARVETSGLALRRPVEKRALERAVGARIEAVRRVGKYLMIDLANDRSLLWHLGMSGQLVVEDAARARRPHTHAVFALDSGRELRYVDPRRFGVLRTYTRSQLAGSDELAVLGPDPIDDPRFTREYLAAELGSSKRDVKQFLLDQSRVAGLGNIYVCEALYRAGVSPRRRAHTIGKTRANRLFDAIREVLTRAIENRGTSFSDYVDADGLAGSNQLSLAVYGREGEPCRACGRAVRRLVQGARSTFYCAHCQK